MRIFAALLLMVTPAAAADFYQFAVDQDALAGPADFSRLNKPITGPADRVTVRNGHFYRGSERIRFWGVNLAFEANFPEPADAPRVAKRLRKLGVNLVRLHHMDSSPDRDPNTARSTLTTGPYPTLNPVSIARLRGFLDALKAEGIYCNLNLHVGYTFRPDVDQVPDAPGGMPTQSKPVHIFYPRMVDLQVEYAQKLLAALKLKGDPVLAMIEIDNETSLLEAWQRGASFDKNVAGPYREELDRQYKAFTDKPQSADTMLEFLADRDRAYLARIAKAVKYALGDPVPITGTQMGYGGLMNLTSHAAMSYQDNHFYNDHYQFPNARWDSTDWRIRDMSGAGSGYTSYLNMAASRVIGQPFTVSEFNQPWPNRHAAEIDPTLAAFAALQDWDGLMHFAYSHSRRWETSMPNGFDLNSDWTKWPGFGQAAWLFRTGAISPAKESLTIPVTSEMQRRAGREKRNGNIAAGLSAMNGYDPNIAFQRRVGIQLAKETAAMPKASAPYQSSEMTYDPALKLLTIGAPLAAGVFGTVSGCAKTGDIEVETTAEFISLMITSLDEKAISKSARLLLTNPGYTIGKQDFVNYKGDKTWWTLEPDTPGKPSGNRGGGSGPARMQRVEATVTLHSDASRLTIYPLDGKGARMHPIENKKISGGFSIPLTADAPWFEIVAER